MIRILCSTPSYFVVSQYSLWSPDSTSGSLCNLILLIISGYRRRRTIIETPSKGQIKTNTSCDISFSPLPRIPCYLEAQLCKRLIFFKAVANLELMCHDQNLTDWRTREHGGANSGKCSYASAKMAMLQRTRWLWLRSGEEKRAAAISQDFLRLPFSFKGSPSILGSATDRPDLYYWRELQTGIFQLPHWADARSYTLPPQNFVLKVNIAYR